MILTDAQLVELKTELKKDYGQAVVDFRDWGLKFKAYKTNPCQMLVYFTNHYHMPVFKMQLRLQKPAYDNVKDRADDIEEIIEKIKRQTDTFERDSIWMKENGFDVYNDFQYIFWFTKPEILVERTINWKGNCIQFQSSIGRFYLYDEEKGIEASILEFLAKDLPRKDFETVFPCLSEETREKVVCLGA